MLEIGRQEVHWHNVTPGGIFGAFTTSLPAAPASALGCAWAIIGHSEERRDKLQIIQAYDQAAEERGEGVFEDKKPRIEQSLKDQLVIGLKGVKEKLYGRDIVIAYAPI